MMQADNGELPYQYYQRLLANLDKANSKSERYQGFKYLEVAFVELTDISQKNPVLHSWHHHQDGKIMQLAPFSIHSVSSHAGGITAMILEIQNVFQ